MVDVVCQVGKKHTCASIVQLETICSKKVSTFPEEIEIVNEVHTVGVACRQEPGVEAEQSTETPHSTAERGGWC